MEPHEIKPDTQLCTIIGINAQIGIARKYFVKIFKYFNMNIAPIALNIKDEHLTVTLNGLPNSKIQFTYIEPEYQRAAVNFCHETDEATKELAYVDIIEVRDGKSYGVNLENEAKALFAQGYEFDSNTMLMAKLFLIVKRWYGCEFTIDDIPMLMNK